MIALDAQGADRGPATVAEGARRTGLPVTLFGPAAELPEEGPVRVVDSPRAIAGHDEPVRAVRADPEASIVRAAAAVGAGSADALVSAGPTGATLAAAMLHVRRLKGVHRPAIAALLPLPGRPTLLLDAGANTEVRPEHLVQFAYLGAAFMEAVHGVARPRVGLLSVGEEAGKGTPEVSAAHERLAAGAPGLSWQRGGHRHPGGDVRRGGHGRLHGQRCPEDDGGHGPGSGRGDSRRRALGARLDPGRPPGQGKVGRLRRQLDPNAVGGAILLGLRGVVVIAHGGSTADGVAQAVRLARRAVDERMVERTRAALEAGGALRSVPAASVSERHD